MKILFLSDHFPPDIQGGYEIGCSLIASELQRRGHEVTVLTTHSPVNLPERDTWNGAGVYRILYKSSCRYKNLPAGVLGRFLDEYRNMRALNHFLKRNLSFDVIYVWCPWELFTTTFQILYKLNIPVAYYLFDHWAVRENTLAPDSSFCDMTRFRMLKRMFNGLYHCFGLKTTTDFHFDSIHSCSSMIEREFMEKHGTSCHVHQVILFGLDASLYHFNADRKIGKNVRILFLGRPLLCKGIDIAVNAVRILREKNVSATLDIYGYFDENQRTFLEKLIEKAKSGAYVFPHPAVQHGETIDILSCYDILIFSSKYNEAYGLVPLEAMASGAVVVSGGDGGSLDYSRDTENCLLYDKNDSSDCAEKILRLIRDPRLYSEIRSNARKFIETELTFTRTVDRVERSLSELAAGTKL